MGEQASLVSTPMAGMVAQRRFADTAEDPAGSGQASGGEATASAGENSHAAGTTTQGPSGLGRSNGLPSAWSVLDMKGVVQTGERRVAGGQQAAGRCSWAGT